MALSGKTALITGGGTGIGWGIARALAEAGAEVAICGRREEKLREQAASFASEPPIRFQAADVADRDAATGLVAWAIQEFGRIDILVNSAGINIPNRTMLEMRPEQWDQVLQVNATGAYNCIHAALPGMLEQADGLIVNVSSVAGKRALELGGVAYCASKFALTALGTSLSLELRDQGIRVTNVYPGEVETPLLDQRPAPVSAERRAKMVQPEDIGALVVAIAQLPPRAHVPELVIKPTVQAYS